MTNYEIEKFRPLFYTVFRIRDEQPRSYFRELEISPLFISVGVSGTERGTVIF